MTTQPNNKEFDCIAMKQEAQSRIHEETKGMTYQQEIEYFHAAVQQGHFRDWWEQAGLVSGTQVKRAS